MSSNYIEVVAIPLMPVVVEVADRWPDGTIDTFPHESGIGAIITSDGVAHVTVSDGADPLVTIDGTVTEL